MPRELTPEEIQKRFPKKAPEPIAPIPEPVPPSSMGTIMEAAMMRSVVGRPPEIGESAPTLAGQWQVVKTENLHPREDNPRHINVKSKSFRELVESIRAAGIVTPLLGRPLPQRPGCVELLAGHRRRLAGEAAGLDEYPVVVREMNDRTALEVLVFENLDRENLTPLEEARGVDLLLRSNHEAGEIAARMGKTVQWVARRAQLLQLTSQWKKWAEEREVSAAHLELVARLPKAAQDDLFETLTQDGDGEMDTLWMGTGTLATLRERIAEHLMELKGAPWDINNAVLVPKAGACSACPKRSGCQPTLFGDPEDGGDRCLDKSCWKEKRKAHIERRKTELQKEHKGLVLIRGKGADWDEGRGALSDWQFSECKATTAGAKPALIVCGMGEGSLTWVTTDRPGGTREKVSEKKKDSAAAKQAKASLDPKESAKLLAEKQEAHELRRWAWVCRRLQEMIDEADLPLELSMQTAAGLCEMVALFGTDNTSYLTARAKPWNALQAVSAAGGIETRQEVWRFVRPKLKQTLEVFTVSSISKEHHAAIRGAAWLMGTTVEALKAAADAEIPELLRIPAKVRFLSCEPLLGPVSLEAMPLKAEDPLFRYWPLDGRHISDGMNEPVRGPLAQIIHWVIAGGESGKHARPMHPEWVLSLRDQCQASGVPFFFKQWGEWAPCRPEQCYANGADIGMRKIGKKKAGRELDGVEWSEFPTTA